MGREGAFQPLPSPRKLDAVCGSTQGMPYTHLSEKAIYVASLIPLKSYPVKTGKISRVRVEAQAT